MFRNYSFIIILLLIIGFGGILYHYKTQISDLNETVIKQEQIIKDKITELNIKENDLKAKKETILALEEKIKNSSSNTEELLNNLQVLIEIPNEELCEKSDDKEVVKVDENFKKLSNVRNSIYSRYR